MEISFLKLIQCYNMYFIVLHFGATACTLGQIWPKTNKGIQYRSPVKTRQSAGTIIILTRLRRLWETDELSLPVYTVVF